MSYSEDSISSFLNWILCCSDWPTKKSVWICTLVFVCPIDNTDIANVKVRLCVCLGRWNGRSFYSLTRSRPVNFIRVEVYANIEQARTTKILPSEQWHSKFYDFIDNKIDRIETNLTIYFDLSNFPILRVIQESHNRSSISCIDGWFFKGFKERKNKLKRIDLD